MPSYAKKPVIVPVDLDQQPYPLMFRLPGWHYVLAGAGAVISSLFIAAGFYFTWEARAAVWIFAGFGLLMLAGSLWYLFTIKGTFIELTKDHMRYRDYRKVKEIDLSRIYVEIMNNTFVLYTPEQSQKVIPSIYDNNSLLHSLLFKHSEKIPPAPTGRGPGKTANTAPLPIRSPGATARATSLILYFLSSASSPPMC